MSEEEKIESDMRRLFVSYDLNDPGQNYAGVESAIESLGDAIRPLETVWLVYTDKSSSEAGDAIAKAMDSTDKLIVGHPSDLAWLRIPELKEWLDEHP